MEATTSLGTFVQLLAKGAQDVHTTVGPTHSFFATGQPSWKTYDAFSKDPVVNEFNEPQPVFSNDDVQQVFTCSLQHSGDLIVGMMLVIELPELDSGYSYVSDLGYKLIDQLSISVAGVELDQMTGLHMLVKATMSNALNEVTNFREMLNGSTVAGPLDSEADIQDESAVNHKLLHVPIPFWFGRAQVSNGFPLASLVTTQATLKLKLSQLSSIVRPAPDSDVRLRPRMSIVTDNITLDPKVAFALIRSGPSRSLFQQNMHQDYPVDTSAPVQRIELTCNRPVRRLLWLVTASDDPNQVLPDSVLSSRLILEGHDLMSRAPINPDTGDRADGKFSELVQPYLYGAASQPGLYSHSFALRPADVPYGGSIKKAPLYPWAPAEASYESPFIDQPTGAFDFSLTRNFLELTLDPDVVEDGCTVHIFFELYNVLEQAMNEVRPLFTD